MTEVLFYECDVCTKQMSPAEVIGLSDQLKKMVDAQNPHSDGHICIDCFVELTEVVAKWAQEKNE